MHQLIMSNIIHSLINVEESCSGSSPPPLLVLSCVVVCVVHVDKQELICWRLYTDYSLARGAVADEGAWTGQLI